MKWDSTVRREGREEIEQLSNLLFSFLGLEGLSLPSVLPSFVLSVLNPKRAQKRPR